jgi:outer membrane protease
VKRVVMVIALSILLVAGSIESGLSQTAPEVELRKSQAEVGWTFNGGKIYLDIGVQSGYLKGDTTYRISFPEGASELEFPLKTYLLGPEISWSYKNPQKQDKFRVKIRWLTNIGHGSGKMKDSDWIEGDGQPGLDIYSESDIKLKANIMDVNAIYSFWPIKQLSIGPMMGYKYQQFKYNVKNTDQVGIGIYDLFYTTSVPGKTMEYKMVYHIPYFGLNSDILLGKKFKVNMSGGYTPWASAKDRDDHILRYKFSEGDTDGYTYFVNLNAIWNFLPHWFLTISGEYMKIRTTGTQHQSFYAGPDVGQTFDVDDKITSKQRFFSATMTYRF